MEQHAHGSRWWLKQKHLQFKARQFSKHTTGPTLPSRKLAPILFLVYFVYTCPISSRSCWTVDQHMTVAYAPVCFMLVVRYYFAVLTNSAWRPFRQQDFINLESIVLASFILIRQNAVRDVTNFPVRWSLRPRPLAHSALKKIIVRVQEKQLRCAQLILSFYTDGSSRRLTTNELKLVLRLFYFASTSTGRVS